MPRGVDITGQGVNFLVKMDMTEALKMLREFQQGFQNSERAVDTLSQQLQSQFGRMASAMSEYIDDLNRNPNMVGPGGATAQQISGMEKVQRIVEETGRTLTDELRKVNDGSRSLGNTFDTLSNNLKRGSDESRKLEKSLSDISDLANTMKAALAFTGLTVGIGAITQETVEWDKVLTKLELRLHAVGGEYKAIHDDIMRMSKESGGAAENVAQISTELLQMGITGRKAHDLIVNMSEQFGQMFDVDRSGMARFFAQLSNFGLAGEKDMKKLGDTMAYLASDPNAGPGSTESDLAAVQSRMGEIQKLRMYLQAEGKMTEEQLNATTHNLMEQVMVMNRKLGQLGIDDGVLTNLLRLPEQFATEGGQMARGFLASGFSGLGMQVNPEELMGEIKKGNLQKVMRVFDNAIAKLAADPKLIEMVPPEFLQLLLGNMAGGDAKQLIAALENARRSGRGLSEEMGKVLQNLVKSHAEGSALDRLWERYKQSLGKSWDDMVSTMGRLGKQLGVILAGPMKILVDMVAAAARGLESFFEWVQKSGVALRTIQGLFLVIAGATGVGAFVRASLLVRSIWQGIIPLINSAAGSLGAAGAAANGASTAAVGTAAVTGGRLGTAAQSIATGAAAAYASPGAPASAVTPVAPPTRGGLLSTPLGKGVAALGAASHAYTEYSRVSGETGNRVQGAGAGIGAGAGFVGGAALGFKGGMLAAPFFGPAAPFVPAIGAAIGGTIGAAAGSGVGQSIGAVFSPEDMSAAAASGTERGVRAGMSEVGGDLVSKLGETLNDARQREEDRARFGPGGDPEGMTEFNKQAQKLFEESQKTYEMARAGFGTPIPRGERGRVRPNESGGFTPVPGTAGAPAADVPQAPPAPTSPEGSFRGDMQRLTEDAYAYRASQAAAEAELQRQHAQALRDQENERQAEVSRSILAAEASSDTKLAASLKAAEATKKAAAEQLVAEAEKSAADAKVKADQLAQAAAANPQTGPSGLLPVKDQHGALVLDQNGSPILSPPASTASGVPHDPFAPSGDPPAPVNVVVNTDSFAFAVGKGVADLLSGMERMNANNAARRGGGMGTKYEQ